MPSALFNAMGGQRKDLHSHVEEVKKQFMPNADPRQIIQQMLQEGKISQQQYNAAYNQLQQMRSR
jgi:hypothetical protein